MFLVLGLGNPERRYERTRHNAGFLVADRLAARAGATCDKSQYGALVTKVRIGGHDVVVAKPQLYMNLSGGPAASLRGYYKVANQDIIVVHDEVDVPFGQIRIKRGGGAAGHNGIKDLIARLSDASFVRVRFGVGRPPEGWDRADYVLGKWTTAEERDLEALVDLAADAVEAVVTRGLDAAMNVYNTRPKEKPDTPPRG